MSLYFIGDLQGCHAPFQRLLDAVDFSPSRDQLVLLGDLVNRGPGSLAVLRQLMALGDAAECLLGNHDLHLLAVWQGLRKPGRSDTLQAILQAPDCEALMDWLRHRAMALQRQGWLLVHAGALPGWSVAQTLTLAAEVECILRTPHREDLKDFFRAMYGNTPHQWHDALAGADRLRVIVNALTRLRFCTPEGVMEFTSTEGAGAAPPGYLPWFAVPGRATAATPMAFGHWSTLVTEEADGVPRMRHNTLPLDTGCLWGGCLTAARVGAAPGAFELVSVKCAQAKKPEKPEKSEKSAKG